LLRRDGIYAKLWGMQSGLVSPDVEAPAQVAMR